MEIFKKYSKDIFIHCDPKKWTASKFKIYPVK